LKRTRLGFECRPSPGPSVPRSIAERTRRSRGRPPATVLRVEWVGPEIEPSHRPVGAEGDAEGEKTSPTAPGCPPSALLVGMRLSARARRASPPPQFPDVGRHPIEVSHPAHVSSHWFTTNSEVHLPPLREHYPVQGNVLQSRCAKTPPACGPSEKSSDIGGGGGGGGGDTEDPLFLEPPFPAWMR